MSDDRSLEEIRAEKREQLMDEDTADDQAGSETAPSEPIHIDGSAELDDTVGTYDVVLVDFYADWCGPCKMLEPIVEELAAETDAAIGKVDVDANQRLAREYGVHGVPNLVLFADGEAVEQITGLREKETLAGLIDQYS